MSWVFGNASNSIVLVDGRKSVPWDSANARPLDYEGYIGLLWQDAGSPAPEPHPTT
jgi:hypothetical protein